MSDNDINLAALWIPVMAETSHIKADLKKAGEEGKRSFLEGFGMSDVGGKLGEGLLDGLKHSELTGGMTAILTGGIAGMVGAFTEKGLDVINAAFEGTIDLAKETAKTVLEIGESWHEVGRQLELSTSASGEALENLNRSAENIVRNGLDTSMKGLGQTMGVLSQRIGMEAGPALETLTKHVMEAQDRFGQFNTADLAAAFKGFNVGPEAADKALESLVNVARSTGTNLNMVISGAKSGGPVFRQMGLDIGQAAALTAQLSAAGIDAQPIMKALQASMKNLPKGETLADGIQQLIGKLDEAVKAGNTAAEQDLAQKIFGPKWANALDAIQKGLLDTNTLMATFSGDGSESLDELFEHTRTLGNEFDELKNKASEALKPLGEGAIKLLEGGLDELSGAFNQHHDEIVADVKNIGDSFIQDLPQIQEFVGGAIRIFGPFADVLKNVGGYFGKLVEGFGEVWGDLTGNQKLSDDMDKLDTALDKFGSVDFTQQTGKIADWVEGMNVNVPQLTTNFDDLFNHTQDGLGSMSEAFGRAPGGSGFDLSSAFSGMPGVSSSGDSSSTSTGSDGKSYNIAPSAFSIPMPAPSGVVPGGGVPLTQNPNGTWTSPNSAWAHLINRESGGVNQVQKIHDVNSGGNEAEGLFQITPATWRGHGGAEFAPNPLAATPQQQAAVAARILRGNPSGSDWGAGLSGRESAQQLLQGLQGGMPTSGGGGEDAFGYGPRLDLSPSSFDGSGGSSNSGSSLSGLMLPPAGSGASSSSPLKDFLSGLPNVKAAPVPSGSGGDTVWSKFPVAASPIPDANAPATTTPGSPSDGGTPHLPAADASAPINVPIAGYNKEGLPVSGAYGGITYDEAISQQEEINRAQHEVLTSTQRVADAEQKVADAKDALDPAKEQAAQQNLDNAKYSEQEATQRLGDAKRKQAEDWNKRPTESGSGRSGKENDAQQFGSGFLKGIFSDLGFGNALGGKGPLDWGITKLVGGLAGWGLGEANAMVGPSGNGGLLTQIGGGQTGGGLLAGALHALSGINVPKSMTGVPLGPSGAANPTQGMPNVSGAFGAPPGPVIQGDYMPFNVTQHGVDGSGVPEWQEQRNAGVPRDQWGGVPAT